MALPPLNQRSSEILSKEHDKLSNVRDAVDAIRRDGIPELAPSIAKIDEALMEIERTLEERASGRAANPASPIK